MRLRERVIVPLVLAAGALSVASSAGATLAHSDGPYVMPGVFGRLSGTELWAANGLYFYLSQNGTSFEPTRIPGLGGDLASTLLAVAPAGPTSYAVAIDSGRHFGTCGHFEPAGPTTPEYDTSAVAVTADDGRTWTSATIPGCAIVTSLSFVNKKNGFALTHPGDFAYSSNMPTTLDATTNGGETWHVVGPAPQANEIVFSSAQDGFGVPPRDLSRAAIARTTDGGRTWSSMALPEPKGLQGDKVAIGTPTFFDQSDGVVDLLRDANGAKILDRLAIDVTHDGGATWTIADSPVDPDFSSYGPAHESDGDGLIPLQLVPFSAVTSRDWVVLLGPTLYETTTAGKSWTRTVPKPHWPPGSVATIAFASPSRGWAFADGQLFSTADGGVAWSAISSPS